MNSNDNPGISVKLGSIRLKNPIVMCSGTFSSGIEYNNFYDVSMLGAITTKSFSLKPREGNKPPRLCETSAGLLNSIGLQNEGIDFFIYEHLPFIKRERFNTILSMLGSDVNEFSDLAVKVRNIEENLIAVELNLSCPNIEKGGMSLGLIPEEVENVTATVRKILNIPVIVKLSPNIENLPEITLRAKNGGAEAVSLINTVVGMAIDINTFKPKLGNVTGGLSGPAIKPIALAKIFNLHKEKILPIIGMGGIFSWEDAIEFILAGSSAVGLGTVNFVDLQAGKKILDGIIDFMNNKNILNIGDIIGKVKAG
ncbi:MAG: dihydroorotate dehydrogenase [Actinomycetota bacterium]|nr:dihydroorotate dehydrogenase [Actinomycetota bacterium]